MGRRSRKTSRRTSSKISRKRSNKRSSRRTYRSKGDRYNSKDYRDDDDYEKKKSKEYTNRESTYGSSIISHAITASFVYFMGDASNDVNKNLNNESKLAIDCCNKMNEYKKCMVASAPKEQEVCRLRFEYDGRCKDFNCDIPKK